MFGTYSDLVAAWKALRGRENLAIREVACVGAPRTLLCVELGDYRAPTVSIATGINGDERTGPIALYELVRDRLLDPHYSYRLWPCMNPTGFDRGTRGNSDGIDLNRTFGRGGSSPEAKAILTATRDHRYILSLDLHDDLEENGFYCYSYGEHAWAETMCASLASDLASDPLQTPDPEEELHEIGGYSYSLAFARRGMVRVGTLEAPGRLPEERRVALMRSAVLAALTAKLLTPPPP